MKKNIQSGIKKRGMLDTLMALLILIFIGCKENKNSKDHDVNTNSELIQSVEVVSAGGELGFSSKTSIDKDSIHYDRTVAANPSDSLSYNRKMKSEDWKNLEDRIDLKMFGATKEGPSVQPVDGIDTRIIITTSAGEISKMNAQNNPQWKNILGIIDQYNDEYK